MDQNIFGELKYLTFIATNSSLSFLRARVTDANPPFPRIRIGAYLSEISFDHSLGMGVDRTIL